MLAVTPQVLREYLAVTTRPESGNGLGLEMAAALANVETFLTRLTVLDDDRRHFERFADLLAIEDLN